MPSIFSVLCHPLKAKQTTTFGAWAEFHSMPPNYSLEMKDILLSLASCNTGFTKLSHTVESFFSVAIWPLTESTSLGSVK
jgi:hypothetical protein